MIGRYATIRTDLVEEWAGPLFPAMRGSTAEEWRVFLNAQTGLNIGINDPAGKAFDAWRTALGLM